MRLFTLPLSTWVLVLLLAGCARIPVSVDYDPQQNFQAFQTYAWLEPAPAGESERIYNSELFGRRVQAVMDREMKLRGLRQVADPQAADLLVAYHLGLDKRVDVRTYGGSFGHPGCIHCVGYSGDAYVTVNDYQQLVLTLDLREARERKLVWRGVAERLARTYDDPAKYEQYVEEIVNAVLTKLPATL